LTLAQGERDLFVEHVLVHAGFIARRLTGRLARIPHALQHHLQKQCVDLLRDGAQGLRRARIFLERGKAGYVGVGVRARRRGRHRRNRYQGRGH
jgi:hypothetical protein